MLPLDINGDELSARLLALSRRGTPVWMLDSCGVGHLGSHLLIAGVSPVGTMELFDNDSSRTVAEFERSLSGPHAVIFTLTYDLGLKLHGISSRHEDSEPHIAAAFFKDLVIHDYSSGQTFISGARESGRSLAELITKTEPLTVETAAVQSVSSNLSRTEYMANVEKIREAIRSGTTYQANLTRQLTAVIPDDLSPQSIFSRLRRNDPAPFAAFLDRPGSHVISASPERFFRLQQRHLSVSPIKGTRPRGNDADSDARLREELAASEKDRAENIMIVDLLRNDIGRVCDFGSVRVDKLCDIETHPTLFHLVSTVTGTLRHNVGTGEVIRSLFPCGSITGAPKISTMRILDDIEAAPRGLSMGAIGYSIPDASFGLEPVIDMSVAIRTMTIRSGTAVFNVGGGIVIDSDPAAEFDETVTKSKALLSALGCPPHFRQSGC